MLVKGATGKQTDIMITRKGQQLPFYVAISAAMATPKLFSVYLHCLIGLKAYDAHSAIHQIVLPRKLHFDA